MRDEGRVEARLSVPEMGEPAEGQAVSTDGARVHAVSGQGQEAVQKSPKVKRKGWPARGEQLRTEEMKVMTLLVTFELRVTLISEMTKLRLTRLSDLPKVIQLPSDEAGFRLAFLARNTVTYLPRPPPTAALALAWLMVKPFGRCGPGRKNSCLASHHMFGASGWECCGLPRPRV